MCTCGYQEEDIRRSKVPEPCEKRSNCASSPVKHEENSRQGEPCNQGGTVINRPVVTKFWVNGGGSEDRDEWTEEVRARLERCYDDKEEVPEMHVERIRRQSTNGDRRVALQRRRITITVDQFLRTRGKTLRNKANGPADCLTTEMLQCWPTETVYEDAYWFDKRLKGECRVPESWKISVLCSSRSLTSSSKDVHATSVRSHF